MYEKRFGLEARPFRSLPVVSAYYPATASEHALCEVRQAWQDGEALMALVGEAGTGKTLLCHCLLSRMGEVAHAYVGNSHLPDRASLLQAILFECGLPYEGKREQELRLALTEHLLEQGAAQRALLLIIDDAHHLSPDLLEELRLLGNVESEGGRALQVLLVGQPTLLETLHRPELASCAQRLAVEARTEPLDLTESVDYLRHHLRVAGGQPEKIFTHEAMEMLAKAGRGLPRKLNQLAHRALRMADEAELSQVDAEVLLEVLELTGVMIPEDKPEAPEREEAEGDRERVLTLEAQGKIMPRQSA